jgi:hypothetical protein
MIPGFFALAVGTTRVLADAAGFPADAGARAGDDVAETFGVPAVTRIDGDGMGVVAASVRTLWMVMLAALGNEAALGKGAALGGGGVGVVVVAVAVDDGLAITSACLFHAHAPAPSPPSTAPTAKNAATAFFGERR